MALNSSSDTAKRVVALAGGVGGAKLADGLYRILPANALTVIVNTGDDFRHYGLYVSPDLDTVLYTLAGLAHPVNGWGLAEDSRQMIEMMKRYGDEAWFGLGDKDLATNLLRTAALANGRHLSDITQELARRLGVTAMLLPMCDDQIATIVDTVEYGRLNFQEYFVRYRWQPVVKRLEYRGAENANPAPGALDAIDQADVIVICPSNPLLSIEPILQVKALRAALQHRRVPCLCVSPIIAGNALKGPAAKLMTELGLAATASGVSAYYGNLIDGFVIDAEDRASSQDIPVPVLVSNIVMRDQADRVRLATQVLDWATTLEVRG